MRGDIVLCALVSSVEAARRGRLSHAKVEVRLILLAQNALHRAVIRHPSVCTCSSGGVIGGCSSWSMSSLEAGST